MYSISNNKNISRSFDNNTGEFYHFKNGKKVGIVKPFIEGGDGAYYLVDPLSYTKVIVDDLKIINNITEYKLLTANVLPNNILFVKDRIYKYNYCSKYNLYSKTKRAYTRCYRILNDEKLPEHIKEYLSKMDQCSKKDDPKWTGEPKWNNKMEGFFNRPKFNNIPDKQHIMFWENIVHKFYSEYAKRCTFEERIELITKLKLERDVYLNNEILDYYLHYPYSKHNYSVPKTSPSTH